MNAVNQIGDRSLPWGPAKRDRAQSAQQDKGDHGSGQQGTAYERSPDCFEPHGTIAGKHRAVSSLVGSNQLLCFGTAHAGDVVHIELAMGTKSPRVAALHFIPRCRTRRGNFKGVED